MAYDAGGDIAVYNPDKQISEQITLKNLIIHDKAMRLARTGVPEEPSEKPLNSNERTSSRFKGLNEIISAQQCLITNANPIVEHNSKNEWGKQHRKDEEKEKCPFDKDDNDYNELIAILDFLDDCEQEIITARRTKKFDDDFVWEKDNNDGGKTLELSPNFFKMMKGLEESYRVIYGIMLRNKIVSSGISVDEDMEDKEKEEEAMRRIVNS
jgi:hypothetical protein